MFSAVRIGAGELNVGAIAEAMIYYGRVNVFVRGGTLPDLIEQFGYDDVIAALDLGVLELTFERTLTAVNTNQQGNLSFHDFGNISLAGTAKGKKIQSAVDEIEHQFTRRFGNTLENRGRAQKLVEKIQVLSLDDQILKLARLDVKDSSYVVEAIRAWLRVAVPEYELPKTTRIEVASSKDGFVFLGNLDFAAINEVYHRRIPASHSTVTPAYLLSHILDARKELTLAAGVNADLWVGDALSAVLQKRVSTIAATLTKSRRDIDYFHIVEFEGRNFREVINKREKTGADLIALLQDKETQKFKTWLAAQSPESYLLKEYDRAVFTRHRWTQRLPFKVTKIVGFAGLGAIVDLTAGTMGLASLATAGLSAASDVAVSTADEFVLPKLLKGWKPNQFIEGPAKEFFNKDQ